MMRYRVINGVPYVRIADVIDTFDNLQKNPKLKGISFELQQIRDYFRGLFVKSMT